MCQDDDITTKDLKISYTSSLKDKVGRLALQSNLYETPLFNPPSVYRSTSSTVKAIPVKLLRRTALHHAEAFSQALFVELKPEKFSSVVDVRFTTPRDI